MTAVEENVDAICKQRESKVKDFDSYRRRLKDLTAKKVSYKKAKTYIDIFIYSFIHTYISYPSYQLY